MSYTGKSRIISAPTPALLSNQPVRVDSSEIGKLYLRSADELLNLQPLPFSRIDQALFSNESGYRGVLPRAPTPFSYTYVRPPKDNEMAGFQPPAFNAREQRPGSLTDVPILRQLPPSFGSYMN